MPRAISTARRGVPLQGRRGCLGPPFFGGLSHSLKNVPPSQKNLRLCAQNCKERLVWIQKLNEVISGMQKHCDEGEGDECTGVANSRSGALAEMGEKHFLFFPSV